MMAAFVDVGRNLKRNEILILPPHSAWGIPFWHGVPRWEYLSGKNTPREEI